MYSRPSTIADNSTGGPIAGVSIEVADLVGVRALLAELRANTRPGFGSPLSGANGMRMPGRGMEYEETRAYLPGDDARRLDWRVMARTGQPHSKRFVEERERRVLLVVDLSASMFFGTRVAFKSWAAARVAAHLGWMAFLGGDRVGGLIAASGWHHEVRPGRTRQSLLTIFQRLAGAGREAWPAADRDAVFNRLLHELHRVARSGCDIALISDFLGLDDQSDDLLVDIRRHNNVNAWWIHDTCEIDPWPPGRYPVMIDDRIRSVDVSDKNDWLRQRQLRHRQRVEALDSRFGIGVRPISCNHDITRQVLAGQS